MAEAVVIGECMVELSLDGAGGAAVGYAGDTFNTAVYLSRLGIATAYGTALGARDPFSDGVLALMAREGVARELVVEAPGRLPGLYATLRDADGERSFFYWRSEAPARDYLRLVDLARLEQALSQAKLVYVSAITLAILGEAGRATLSRLLAVAKAAGAEVALDTNHRARLWPDAATARAAIEAVAPLCRWISASAEDLGAFSDDPNTPARWAAAGAEVVLRRPDHGVEVLSAEGRELIAPDAPVAALDTTGAGDAFNAAYLAARLAGRPPADAVAEGRRLAAAVVRYVGAIIPREAMP
jgi:2-dehydro-3-deoxygluconokinase